MDQPLLQFANAACPVCNARDLDPAGVVSGPKHMHTMHRCRICKVVVDGRLWAVDPSQDLAGQAAATGDYYARTYTEEEFRRRIKVAEATLGEFAKFMRDTSCFVELGVGEGFLSRAAAGQFTQAYGLDLDLTAAESVTRQFGCPHNLGFLPHAQFDPQQTATVSVVAMWHVLEHLRDPLQVLRPFLDRMPAGGLVIGQVPLLRDDYVFDEHFLFHNESSLFHLADALGCSPILLQRDETNDFLSFCFRKQDAPARPSLAQQTLERTFQATSHATLQAAPHSASPRAQPATLRSLGVPALFVFGHQRSGTNILMDTIAAGIGCDVINEGDPAGFGNFRLRPAAEIAALVEASGPGCLLKPISETLRFRGILQGFPGSRGVFIIRNPLDVVPSFLTEFRASLASVAYETVHNYCWTRLRDVGATLDSWDAVDRVLAKYAGRFDARNDLPSVTALSWLLLHTALQSMGILQAADCAVVDYDDLFDGCGALGRKMAPLFNAPPPVKPAQRRRRDTHFYSSSVDVELMKDCLDAYHAFRSGRVSHV